MKFISWNVNGIRACIGKGFEESFHALECRYFLSAGEPSARGDR